MAFGRGPRNVSSMQGEDAVIGLLHLLSIQAIREVTYCPAWNWDETVPVTSRKNAMELPNIYPVSHRYYTLLDECPLRMRT